MRFTVVVVMLLGLVAMGPGLASAQNGGNSEAAQACQKGGFASLARTEDPRTPFVNTGDCASYAAQGGVLTPLLVLDLAITRGLGGFNGIVSGSGFTPNSTIVTLVRVYSPDGTVQTGYLGNNATDATGSFATDARYDFCFRDSSAVEITATDAAGLSNTESFTLAC